MKKTSGLGLLLVALAGFWLAGLANAPLHRMRVSAGLSAPAALENASPLMTFTTVVIGGFRGLLADALWLRVSALQEQGKFIELVQLADWITKLEPRTTEIWAYHAWNLAYNVSAMMRDPEDRWRWVENGIRLLRDEGLEYNTRDPDLYAELGWMYQHKIGSEMDEANRLYKRTLAESMTALLGGARPDPDALRPGSEAERRCRQEYKLLPEVMREIDRRYGPLDWRLPETHAIYWAWRGRSHAGPGGSLVCSRMIYQSMAQLLRTGALEFQPGEDVYRRGPNLDLLRGVLLAYEDALRQHPIPHVREAYQGFLHSAVVELHGLGHDTAARRLFALLHEQFPSPETAAGFESFMSTAGRNRPEAEP